jgi:hypothetical protein
VTVAVFLKQDKRQDLAATAATAAAAPGPGLD